MNERRRTVTAPQKEDLNRKRLLELRSEEKQLEAVVQSNKPLVDGAIDYSQYDAAMNSLRVVRAEMAVLARSSWK